MTEILPTGDRRADARRRWRVGLESFVAVTATAGGVLLAAQPDGGLLDAQLSALDGSPFSDWRVPGLLLLGLVGGGYALTAVVDWRRVPWAPALALFAGLGLVAFELAEVLWLGVQPLQAVFAVIGVAVAALSRPAADRRRRAPRHLQLTDERGRS